MKMDVKMDFSYIGNKDIDCKTITTNLRKELCSVLGKDIDKILAIKKGIIRDIGVLEAERIKLEDASEFIARKMDIEINDYSWIEAWLSEDGSDEQIIQKEVWTIDGGLEFNYGFTETELFKKIKKGKQ